MKKLSNQKVMVIGAIALYTIAYKAGKKDGVKYAKLELNKHADTFRNEGYLKAIADVTGLVAENKRGH